MKLSAYSGPWRFLLGAALMLSVFSACEKARSITDPNGTGSSSGGSSSGGGSSSAGGSGSSSGGGSSSSGGTYFDASINGTAWVATTISGFDAQSIGNTFGLTGITGSGANSTTFLLSIPGSVHTGSVLSFDGIGTSLSYINVATGVSYSINVLGTPTGAVTISSLNATNKTISGTFSQTVLYNSVNSNDSITVTNGKFSMSYIIE